MLIKSNLLKVEKKLLQNENNMTSEKEKINFCFLTNEFQCPIKMVIEKVQRILEPVKMSVKVMNDDMFYGNFCSSTRFVLSLSQSLTQLATQSVIFATDFFVDNKQAA